MDKISCYYLQEDVYQTPENSYTMYGLHFVAILLHASNVRKSHVLALRLLTVPTTSMWTNGITSPNIVIILDCSMDLISGILLDKLI